MNASWRDALDLQMDLSAWLASPRGQMFGAGYFASAYQSDERAHNVWKDEGAAVEAGADWTRRLAIRVFNAEPVFVEPDMMTVVEAAVAGFLPEPLVDTDLITPNGLLILPRSLSMLDRNGKTITWRAACWFTGVTDPGVRLLDEGIHLVLLHDDADPDSFDIRVGSDGFTTYKRLIKGAPLLPTHISTWDFGEMHPATTAESTEAGIAAGMTVQRQFQGIMRLLQQHLAEVGKQRPPRDYLKRAKRANLPHEHVTIVRLRRPAQERDVDEPTTVHWSHRWIVGGHWRNQWYASTQMHRQIWISPYVKGPEELELVVNKARIFQLVR